MSRPHLQWVCYPWELGTIYPGPWVGVEGIRMNRLVKFLSPYSTQETIFNNFLIIYHKLYLFMQLPCVIIRDIIFLPGFLLYLVCLYVRDLKAWILTENKLIKNPGKNIISLILHVQGFAYIILYLFKPKNARKKL